jgi:hypothetical protein
VSATEEAVAPLLASHSTATPPHHKPGRTVLEVDVLEVFSIMACLRETIQRSCSDCILQSRTMGRKENPPLSTSTPSSCSSNMPRGHLLAASRHHLPILNSTEARWTEPSFCSLQQTSTILFGKTCCQDITRWSDRLLTDDQDRCACFLSINSSSWTTVVFPQFTSGTCQELS